MIQPSSEIRVLLVDDESSQLEIIKTYLKGHNKDLHFESTDSAVKALELARGQHFDCVVSDYVMPYMNGVELCVKLRGEGCEAPFILFTSQDDEKMIRDAFVARVDDYLGKAPNLAVLDILDQRIRGLVSKRANYGSPLDQTV